MTGHVDLDPVSSRGCRRPRGILAALGGGVALTAAAPVASAAALDWDCDEEVGPVDGQDPAPGQPVTIEGDRCTQQPGDPEEGIHVISVYYGQDWICQRVEETEEPGHIVGYGCIEADTA